MSISGPLITVSASTFFDPRILSDLQLWLAHFTIPATSPGEGLTNHWLGAPALATPVVASGSPADSNWTNEGDWLPGAGPPWGQNFGAGTSGAVFYDDTEAFESGFFRWVTGAVGGLFLRDIRAVLVDTGTSTPRTITLAGPLTIVLTIGDQYEEGQYLLRGALTGPTAAGIMVPYSRMEVEIGEDNFVQVTGDVIEEAGATGRVSLVMVTRDASDIWHCWVDGVAQAGTFTEAGEIALTHLGQTSDHVIAGFSNLLLYSADHSTYASQMATYFAGQYGASAGLEP